jgi:hypothetical protein
MPELPTLAEFDGTAGIHGNNVDGPVCPGITGDGVGPSPTAGAGPSAGQRNGDDVGAPLIIGDLRVDADCAKAILAFAITDIETRVVTAIFLSILASLSLRF